MALVNWDPSYSVKVNRCDEDHKKLFALINALHDAMLTGKGSEILQQVVKELADYTKFHFTAEESLLERTRYPALNSHRSQHQQFVQKVQTFQNDLNNAQGAHSIQVLSFLKEWLVNHIKNTDQQYSAHLNANGVN